MDPLALGFIALAAVLHVAWNILLKTAGDPLRTATVGVVAASAALIPMVVAGWLLLGRPGVPPEAWLLGIVSGLVEVAYFVFLAAAYRRGDLSVIYPLARGTAPLLAVAVGVLVLGERLPPGAWVGVGLLVAGLLVVQRPWLLLGAARDRRAGAGFALLAGFLTFIAYAFVLAALSRAPLAIVAPLRESAVVLASTWGVLRLREAAGRREIGMRVAGSVLVLAGAAGLAIAR